MSHQVIMCLALPPHIKNRQLTLVTFPVDEFAFLLFFFFFVCHVHHHELAQKQGTAEGSRLYPSPEYFKKMVKSLKSRFFRFLMN